MEKPVILIIDDDQNMRKSLSDILTLKGYQVLTAQSGAEGLALLGQQFVSLALIDLGLPDISGLDVLERMRASSPATQAIVLTGQATVHSALEAANRGAYSYMLKPNDMELLLLHVKRATRPPRNTWTSSSTRSTTPCGSSPTCSISPGPGRPSVSRSRRGNWSCKAWNDAAFRTTSASRSTSPRRSPA